MARGLEKENPSDTLPRRNPFRQEIKGREEVEKKATREERKNEVGEEVEKLARRESIITSPLSGLYQSRDFAEASHLLGLISASPKEQGRIKKIGEDLFPKNPSKAQEASYAQWQETASGALYATVVRQFDAYSNKFVNPYVAVDGSVEEGTRAADAYLASIPFSKATRLLATISICNEKSRPQWANVPKSFDLELKHFALAAENINQWQESVRDFQLTGQETDALSKTIEELFLKELYLFIGRDS